ncbi:hypothetical protein CEXT_60291 [Caerostris extrusa]|uniref:Uncharacterized protein n=1 Tax=Caerostris extrusa TaxID=172846 RepID=A0AAV4RH50_CAEEX|nr:hypothetical protein CEXT_60291 [Caerostris extrusa]
MQKGLSFRPSPPDFERGVCCCCCGGVGEVLTPVHFGEGGRCPFLPVLPSGVLGTDDYHSVRMDGMISHHRKAKKSRCHQQAELESSPVGTIKANSAKKNN